VKTNLLSIAIVLLAVTGCSRAVGEGAATEPDAPPVVKEITPTEVAELQKQNAVHVFDANTDDFRAEHGKIPGAVLLASSSRYDLGVLPQDKSAKLVFYCTNRL
jgi:hypothetical protein